MMGGQIGFGEERGKMFFMLWKILRIKQPRYVLLENVKNLVSHNNGRTYLTIKRKLEELGYHVSCGIFNSAWFGLPQIRNRVFIFATLDDDFAAYDIGAHIQDIRDRFNVVKSDASVFSYETVLDILSKDADEKYYLSERVKPTILSDGTGGFQSKSEINKLIARPLTASMHKMHRACQDNYYSKCFIESSGTINDAEGLTKEELSKLPIRKLTPREAFMLQGFPQDFVYNAHQVEVSNGALYKQAGNAVSVNVIYTIVEYLIHNNIINE
jgi:DNA (cytosine-5)-methyltransferase 1